MKSQTTLKLVFACLISSIIIFTPSCKKDETLDRVKFLGSYQVNENCATGTYSYSITIVESATGDNAIIIQDLGDFPSTINVTAIVSNDNITLSGFQDGITISGSGSITGNTLTIIYQTTGTWDDSCTATCIKQ